jgi:hypothetical protein
MRVSDSSILDIAIQCNQITESLLLQSVSVIVLASGVLSRGIHRGADLPTHAQRHSSNDWQIS